MGRLYFEDVNEHGCFAGDVLEREQVVERYWVEPAFYAGVREDGFYFGCEDEGVFALCVVEVFFSGPVSGEC